MPKIGNIILPDFPLLLAPMEDVSDPPFRRLCKLHGADLMYSEFISSEGLIRDAMKSKQKLDIFDYERPVGIQIFGGDEEAMEMSAKIVDTVQPDLVDINFGCPVKKVVCKGAGAGEPPPLPRVPVVDPLVDPPAPGEILRPQHHSRALPPLPCNHKRPPSPLPEVRP